jgi:DNA-binding ferritin-like protein (Dps family)
MENTLRKFRAPLFADWGSDVSAALAYVAQLSSASAEGPAINTAAHVLLNTVINAVDKMLAATSPEKLAIIELINAQIDTWAKDSLLDSLGRTMDSMMDDKIESWMDDNLGDKVNDMLGDSVGDWADDNLGDRIESWMDDNLGNKINDIDFVVRVR